MPPTSKVDPLEAAKVTPTTTAADAAKLDAAGKPPVTAATPPPAEPAPVAAEAEYVPRRVIRFRVMKEWRASFHGQVHIMKEGKLLDPAGYGGEQALINRKLQGAPLERMEVEI